MNRSARTSSTALVLVLSMGLAGLGLGSTAAATTSTPSLRVFAAQSEITFTRYKHERAPIDPGVFVTPVGAAFELHVQRASYSEPITLTQLVQTPSGPTERRLPRDLLDGFGGLAKFMQVVIRDDAGNLVQRYAATFCPNTYDPQRVNDRGPANPTYPMFCGYNPFTIGMVWGIDRGWAVDPLEFNGRAFRGPDGHYVVTVRIARTYADLFGISPKDASAQVGVTVVTATCCKSAAGPSQGEMLASHRAVATDTSPEPSTLPDLVPLPAWGINALHRGHRDFVAFGATVWVGAGSQLDVEGFRRADTDIMDAYQYFYRDGEVVGRANVGTMEYDSRPSHQHWHFTQFASYRLLDASQTLAVRSHKQGFCIAPTDAIDLLIPNAVLNPGFFGFSQCGSETSIWVREEMPLGWGDTYFQYLAGQSFDITDVPNGTYYVEVVTNPEGLLYETNTDNDVSLREITLCGTPGNRSVGVPAYDGIDPEGRCK